MSKKTDGHINSYYAKSAGEMQRFPRFSGGKTVQVCVIGGGLAGLTCARELSGQGFDVVLLESNRIGWAASGRNGGFVSAGFAEDMGKVAARCGVDRAKALYEQSQMGAAYVKTAIEEFGCKDIFQSKGGLQSIVDGSGGLELIRHRRIDDVALEVEAFNERYGTAHKFWHAERVRQQVHSQTYQAAVFDPDAFHIHPLRYAYALARNACERGASLYEESAVRRISKDKNHWRVETDEGALAAQHVVLATSAYGGVFPPLERSVLKISTYVVASQPLGSKLDRAISFDGTMSDTRRAGDYFRVIGEGDKRRLLWGGRITTRRSEPARLSDMLRGDIETIFPQLMGIQFESAWSGVMAYARHKMPLIGQFWADSAPNLWACTAFGGHGLNTTAMGGKLVADAIAAVSDSHRLFANYPPVWAGGVFGQAATQAIYWQMQLKDAWEERARGQ